ncbi:hypothetical protein K488DRAFT_87433 [Vararia minispora EC-137]|uniref:Uncharacterized protein n=1 Tax=Vararia minispora EC-137 TaxID=1314806 RepID=A0ACB8QGL9_9AGAM|nr:hypothetical protein K488DRAFT_87433 [Vararia minispora EC-137]
MYLIVDERRERKDRGKGRAAARDVRELPVGGALGYRGLLARRGINGLGIGSRPAKEAAWNTGMARADQCDRVGAIPAVDAPPSLPSARAWMPAADGELVHENVEHPVRERHSYALLPSLAGFAPRLSMTRVPFRPALSLGSAALGTLFRRTAYLADQLAIQM